MAVQTISKGVWMSSGRIFCPCLSLSKKELVVSFLQETLLGHGLALRLLESGNSAK